MKLDKDGMNVRRQFLLSALSLLLAFSVMVAGSTSAAAQSLNELRSTGVLGEGYDGLVHVRTSTATAQAVANSVNAKRTQIYAKRAREQGISPAQVGRVYAGEIFTKAAKGIWFLNESGSWRQK